MADPIYLIWKIALPADQWTPVICPILTSSWGVRNASTDTVLLRSDQNDPNTEDTLAVGAWELCLSQTEEKFFKGTTLLFAKVQTAGVAGELVARFVS